MRSSAASVLEAFFFDGFSGSAGADFLAVRGAAAPFTFLAEASEDGVSGAVLSVAAGGFSAEGAA
jgi:hypothetical protein